MGWYKAKCPQCWDPIPCGCGEQFEREASALASQLSDAKRARDEQNSLLREQVALLKRIAQAKP